MFAFFLIVLLVPLAVGGVAFIFLDSVTLKEFGVVAVACLLVSAAAAGIVSFSNTSDVEVWNGNVSDKAQVRVSCSHSYECRCKNVTRCTGSGKNRTCSTERKCDTCYEHSNDWDWDVHTTLGETITIQRVDRRGSEEPPRFTQVVIGEPTASTHGFTNYVKASPGTLFRHQGLSEKYAASLPAYPQNVYDYYRIDRLVTAGLSLPDASDWNADLSRINAELGRPKQVNIIVVIAMNKPNDWYYALEESWIGGKKNDAVLVVSVDEQFKPQWASVMAWTTNETFKVKLRDDVMDEQIIDRQTLVRTLETNVSKHYVRKPMKDFEYLSSQIVPSTVEWIVTLIVSLLVSIALTIYMHVNDVFGDEGRPFRSRQRFNY